MMRKMVAAAASAALCSMSVASALYAQDYRYSGFDAPRGATATVNLRVPLGAAQQRQRPTMGITASYGHTVGSPTLDGRTTTREMRLAEMRFDREGINTAEVATFDLANLDQDRRLAYLGDPENKDPKGVLIGLLVLLGAGFIVYLLVEDDGNNNNVSNNSS